MSNFSGFHERKTKPENSSEFYTAREVERLGLSMIEANNILTPEELATRLKVPKTWIFEKTRTRLERDLAPISRKWLRDELLNQNGVMPLITWARHMS